jgi:hypothetical protein
MTVTEPASVRNEDVRDGYGLPKTRDEAGWPRGMPDPASPGLWPHDSPQPPTHTWVMRLEKLDGDWATWECRDPMSAELVGTLTVKRDAYEDLDSPDALGVVAQRYHGAKPARRRT